LTATKICYASGEIFYGVESRARLANLTKTLALAREFGFLTR
jgi:hypothetical protein